jgi:flagellar hook-associated protein 3 FlgL
MVSVSSYSTISLLISQQSSVRDRFDQLSRQASDGHKAVDFAGLGGGLTRQSVMLRVQQASRGNFSSTIQRVAGQLDVTQTALTKMSEMANSFADLSAKLMSGTQQDISTAPQQAKDALSQLVSLLNTEYGGDYVFSGSDTSNPPIPNASQIFSSGFYVQIGAEVASLTATNGATVAANTKAIASSNAVGTTPFSAFLSDASQGLNEPRRAFFADSKLSVTVGIKANANGSAVSTGNATTGSWARDLMRNLAVVANMDPAQSRLTPGFSTLISDVGAGFKAASAALAQEEGSLGATQKQIDDQIQHHKDLTTIAGEQLNNVEDVDMADVLSRLQLVQVQLQSSYKILGSLTSLSLVNYMR